MSCICGVKIRQKPLFVDLNARWITHRSQQNWQTCLEPLFPQVVDRLAVGRGVTGWCRAARETTCQPINQVFD